MALVLAVSAAVPAVGAAAATAQDGPVDATTADAGAADADSLARTQADCGYPYSAEDATGTEVTLEERPERITTLNPSAAQTMWEIGGEDQVVGVTQYASYLEGADERTNVSAAASGWNPSVSDRTPITTERGAGWFIQLRFTSTTSSFSTAGVLAYGSWPTRYAEKPVTTRWSGASSTTTSSLTCG